MSITRIVAITLVAVMFVAPMGVAQERKIKRSNLPPAVEKTIAAQSRAATIRGFSEEKEQGKTYYEAEMVVDGHRKDVLVDENGAIVEVEEQVAFDSLPLGIRDGLRARLGKGKLLRVESITKHDQLVGYEAQVMSDKKKFEIQVGPDGQPLDHEE